MNRSTVLFFFVLVIIVVLIARCNSRSRSGQEKEQSTVSSPLVPTASASPEATVAKPTATPQASSSPMDAKKVAAAVQPAVVTISVFEPSGKLLRTGTGVFVSSDGRVLTTRSLMEGAAHAIAKTADNKIHNVSGILSELASDDLALLNLELKDRVPAISPNTAATIDEGAPVAVVQSPLGRTKATVHEEAIRKKHRDSNSEWLELADSVPGDAFGAPVVNASGDMIGLVTKGPGDPAVVVRTAATLNALLSKAPIEGKGKSFAEATPSPTEGPLKKVPLAQNPAGRRSKLIYSPPPPYPNAAGMVKGSGRFRLSFDANGQVRNIMILKSTQSGILDRAAIDTLRKWKSEPGQQWELNVPITFQ